MASRAFRGAEGRIRFTADTRELASAGFVMNRIAGIFETAARRMESASNKVLRAQERLAASTGRLESIKAIADANELRRQNAIERMSERTLRLHERESSLTEALSRASDLAAARAAASADRLAITASKLAKAQSDIMSTPQRAAETGIKVAGINLRADAAQAREVKRQARVVEDAIVLEDRLREAIERRVEVLDRVASRQAAAANTGLSLARLQRQAAVDTANLEAKIAQDRQTATSQVANEAKSALAMLSELSKRSGEAGDRGFLDLSNFKGNEAFDDAGIRNYIQQIRTARTELMDLQDLTVDQAQQIYTYESLENKFEQLLLSRQKLANFEGTADEARLRQLEKVSSLAEKMAANTQSQAELKKRYSAEEIKQADKILKSTTALDRAVKERDRVLAESSKFQSQIEAERAAAENRTLRSHREWVNLAQERERVLQAQLRAQTENDTIAARSSAARISAIDKQLDQTRRMILLSDAEYNNLLKIQDSQKGADANRINAAQGAVDMAQKALDASKGEVIAATSSGAASIGNLSRALTTLKAVGPTAILGAVTIGLSSIAASGATALIRMERLRATFTGLIGDAGKANKILDTLVSTSSKMASPLDKRLEGARTLLTVQEDTSRVAEDLRRLEIMAIVAGQPLNDLSVIYSEILTKQRVYREDILQFSRRGIPIVRELEKNLGKTRAEINQLVSDGAIGFDEFAQALYSMTDSSAAWGRAVNGINDTISGSLTRASNLWREAFFEVGDALDAIEADEVFKLLIAGANNFATSIKMAAGAIRGLGYDFENMPNPYANIPKNLPRGVTPARRVYDATSSAINSLGSMQEDAKSFMPIGGARITANEEYNRQLQEINKQLREANLPEIEVPVGMDLHSFLRGPGAKQALKNLQDLKDQVGLAAFDISLSFKDMKELLLNQIGEGGKEAAKELEASMLHSLEIVKAEVKGVLSYYEELEKVAKERYESSNKTEQDEELFNKTRADIESRRIAALTEKGRTANIFQNDPYGVERNKALLENEPGIIGTAASEAARLGVDMEEFLTNLITMNQVLGNAGRSEEERGRILGEITKKTLEAAQAEKDLALRLNMRNAGEDIRKQRELQNINDRNFNVAASDMTGFREFLDEMGYFEASAEEAEKSLEDLRDLFYELRDVDLSKNIRAKEAEIDRNRLLLVSPESGLGEGEDAEFRKFLDEMGYFDATVGGMKASITELREQFEALKKIADAMNLRDTLGKIDGDYEASGKKLRNVSDILYGEDSRGNMEMLETLPSNVSIKDIVDTLAELKRLGASAEQVSEALKDLSSTALNEEADAFRIATVEKRRGILERRVKNKAPGMEGGLTEEQLKQKSLGVGTAVKLFREGKISQEDLEQELQAYANENNKYKRLGDSYGFGGDSSEVFNRFQGQASRTLEDLLKDHLNVSKETKDIVAEIATSKDIESLEKAVDKAYRTAHNSVGIVGP